MIMMIVWIIMIRENMIVIKFMKIQGAFFDWSAQKTTKNETSLSTRTGPTLQKEQFKYFIFLRENLLRVNT